MRFLNEIDEVNLRRRDRAVHVAETLLGSLEGKRIAVLGVAFKPNSDDVRDSPALDVAARLFNSGADVSVYDPAANANAGKRYPRLNYVDSLATAAADADLVMVLTEWTEFVNVDPAELSAAVSRKRIFDGRNVLDHDKWSAAGWDIVSLGHKSELLDLAASAN